mgnify:CR=1 FL=1
MFVCWKRKGWHRGRPTEGKNKQERNYKAMVKTVIANNGGQVYFKKIVLEHNHVLTRSPTMTKHMRSHKLRETGLCEMIDSMHRAKVSHVNVMSVLRDSVGGSANLTLSERDVQNRYKSTLITEYWKC